MKKFLFVIIFSFSISVFVCLNVQAQSELKTKTPITIGETLSIQSKGLNEEREIRVFLPRNYADSNKKYPVIYTLDGEGTGSVTANTAEFMTSYSAITSPSANPAQPKKRSSRLRWRLKRTTSF